MKQAIVTITFLLILQTSVFGQDKVGKQFQVTIHPLAYGGNPPRGFASSESMRFERVPAPSDRLQDRLLTVGYIGNVPEGIGHTLRASLWNAASVAGKTKNDPLFDSSFILRLKGRVDGPSAGGLFTISMLAMLQGDKLKPDVTMTGTILPDGSIGAVGGVRYKMVGAKNAGMSKVLVPEYLRVEIDREKGDVIDLEEHGKKLGLEVAFVSNIKEAYPHFTGRKLQTSRKTLDAVDNSEITLPGRLERLLKLRTKKRFKELTANLKQLVAGKKPEEIKYDNAAIEFAVSQMFDKEMRDVFARMRMASEHMQANQWVVAFEQVNNAWISAQAILRWQNIDFKVPEEVAVKGMSEKIMLKMFQHRDLLTGGDTQNPVEKAILDVRAFHDGLNIYTKLKVENDWVNFYDQKINELREADSSEEKKEELIETAVNKLKLRVFQTIKIHKMIAILQSAGPAKDSDELDLDLLAGAFTFRGGEEEGPRPLDLEKVKQWFLFGRTRNQILLENLKATLKGEGGNSHLDFDVRKAVALLAFDNEYERDPETTLFGETVLLAKQEVEFAFAIIKTDVFGCQDAAFRGMLANAQKNSREAILRAGRLNYHMYGARYDYLRAEGLRSGDPDDQLQALRLYMSAAAVCRLLESCVKDAE